MMSPTISNVSDDRPQDDYRPDVRVDFGLQLGEIAATVAGGIGIYRSLFGERQEPWRHRWIGGDVIDLGQAQIERQIGSGPREQ